MAVYKIFPEKDAAIYSLFPQMNTGIDEILDVSNLNFAVDSNPTPSRFLIQFDQDQINNLINNRASGSNWDVNLKAYIATAQGINLDSKLYVYPVSGAWGMGTGKYLDVPFTTNGVSWQYQIMSGSKQWDTDATTFNQFVTSSYSGSIKGGGTWFTGSDLPGLDVAQTQTFSYNSDKDLNVTVTDIVEAWYSASENLYSPYTKIDNNGFIIKWEGLQSYEDTTGNYYIEYNQNKNVQPVLQYYSRDTHTIYPPCLEFKWVDYVFNPLTGSSNEVVDPCASPTNYKSVIDTPQLYVSIPNNTGFFYSQSVQQFRVDCRPQFPPIVFQTSSVYTNNYYLPSSSYWAIKDLDTNEYVIDFDTTYTQISADSTSSYFTVYMDGLQPERYYNILLQTIVAGNTLIIDSDFNFKVING
jgi:hypothetical protein